MAEETDLLGWQNARWGMLADEVLVAVGAARVQRTERRNYQRFYSTMKIPNVPLGGLSFDVAFQMDEQSHRLRQVLITHQCDPSREPSQEASMTQTVLEERLGKPQPAGTGKTLLWVFPTTTIALDSFHIAGTASTVGVRYFPTGDDPAAPAPSASGSASA